MAIVKLSAGERRRLSAFFTCLVLAALAWIVTTLSNPYNFTVKPIVADLQSLDKENYVVLNSQLNQINDRDTDNIIVSINPDTLYFDFSNRMVKRVPIRLVAGLRYQRQFAQSNNAVIKPAFVTLVGPSSLIDKITEWDTDSLTAGNVNETIRTSLNLQPVTEGNMTMYPKSIDVVVPVDEFTEKTLDIPVKLVNNRDYYNVKIFPQKVKVTFIIALKKYTEVDEDFFEAQADLDLWRLKGYSTLPVRLTRVPPFCKIISIQPPNIDFIIRK